MRPVWALLAIGLAAGSGCASPAPKPECQPKSRSAFRNALAAHDFAEAAAALSRLENRGVPPGERLNQLGLAQRIDGLLERGRRQIEAGDWPGMAVTRDDLAKARLEVYQGEFSWPPEYIDLLESEYAAFMKEAEAADATIGQPWQ
jgi:hypothetical protein